MRAALEIAGRSLRQRLRDRSAVLVAVVVPLALAAIFAFTLGDAGSGRLHVKLAVVDSDRGAASASLVRDVLPAVARRGIVDLRRATSAESARRLVRDGAVAAAIIVPAGFSRAVAHDAPAGLEVVGNVDQPIGTLVARSIAQSFVGELSAVRTAVVAVTVTAGSRGDPTLLARRAAALPTPLVLADVTGTRRELDARTFYAAGMAVFFLFFTVQFGVSGLLDERREGTLARLLAAPIPRASILGGMVLTCFALGVVSMTVLALATHFLFGARWGDPLGVALLIMAGVLAATAVMSLVATIARSPDQAGWWQSIIALVLGMLGGAFFPVQQAGGVLAFVSLLTPHAWFLGGLADLQGGARPAAVLPSVGAILAFAAVTGTIAFVRMERLVRP